MNQISINTHANKRICTHTHRARKRERKRLTGVESGQGLAVDGFELGERDSGGVGRRSFVEKLLLPVPHGLDHGLVGNEEGIFLGS